MIFDKTHEFNTKLIGINRKPGTVEDKSEFDWMIGTVLEELDELQTAHEEGDFIAELDSVTDALYFIGGFMTRMGIPPKVAKEIFSVVHDCNMMKKKGMKKERDHVHSLDAIKPNDWVAPEDAIMKILEKHFGEV